MTRIPSMLLGALVADAATLGLHWIYDVDRIAAIAAQQGGAVAFTPVAPANYESGKSYFAHGKREAGMLTQYGEVLKLAIGSMNDTGGRFDATAYSTAFAAHFGAGGTYTGYIDRPTRGALDNMASETSPSGIDDDQNPAIATLPAIMAAYHADEGLDDHVIAAMQVTNINDVAAAYAKAFADLLGRVLRGMALQEALVAAASNADPTIRDALKDALGTADSNSTDYAGKVGRACHLPTSGPVMFHILKHSATYRDAVERNILAGGDNAGRSILIGAFMAAALGIATPRGVPLDWVLKTRDADKIWTDCLRLAAT